MISGSIALALGALVVGFALLIKGADWLVEGGSALARKFGISELTIGLTVVAFGTSMPELAVNIISSTQGANDLAIGNIVGSNIANILLILGVSATIRTLRVHTSTVWKEVPLSLLAALVLFFMANDTMIDGYSISELSRIDGLVLLGFFIIFLWYTFGMQKTGENPETHQEKRNVWVSFLLLVVGIVLLVAGGNMAVGGAITIAEAFGISQALIGLTVVALGTSLPELATSVVAALKKKADIAVGNVVGSNIFNIFWILGVSATIRPLQFQPALNADLLMAILATFILFFAIHVGYLHHRLRFWKQREGHVIGRADGIFMLALYVGYIVYLGWRG